MLRGGRAPLGPAALNTVTITYGLHLRLEPLSLALVGKMSEKRAEPFQQSSETLFLIKR